MLGTVLIVEDDQALRRLFKRALALGNFGVNQAGNGHEALDFLEKEDCPNLIMMDLNMPKMSGEEFFRALRANSKCSKVKVLVVSASDDLESRAKELGADAWLTKPVDLDQLLMEVSSLVEAG